MIYQSCHAFAWGKKGCNVSGLVTRGRKGQFIRKSNEAQCCIWLLSEMDLMGTKMIVCKHDLFLHFYIVNDPD